MPDVYLFMNTLEIPNVIEESVVEHLDEKFHEGKHFVLMWWKLYLGLGSEPGELVLGFLL